jgi:hypothetical protein
MTADGTSASWQDQVFDFRARPQELRKTVAMPIPQFICAFLGSRQAAGTKRQLHA